MFQGYQSFWNESRLAKVKKIGNLQQITTLAAIVQGRDCYVDERPKVAGVYMNRNDGIKSDADPTVIYAKKTIDQDFDQVINECFIRT
jgi:UPF0755 protein